MILSNSNLLPVNNLSVHFYLQPSFIYSFSKYLFGSCEMPGAGAALQAQGHQEFLGNQERKELPPQLRQWRIHLPMQETWVQPLGLEDPLEEGMATHSSILAWRIPWTEEPGGLQSMRSQSRTRLKRLSTHARTHHCQWPDASTPYPTPLPPCIRVTVATHSV